MANSLQAKKRARQNEKRRLHNTSLRSKVRTYRKKFSAALSSNDVNAATEAFKQVSRMLDKYAGSTIISKNTASRYKSRAFAALKSLQNS